MPEQENCGGDILFMNYENALLSPDISWDAVTAGIKVPKTLYKYQSFIKADGTANSHWDGNMEGEFHMSLGCEFEDRNDCKPYFSKDFVLNHIDDFLRSFNADYAVRDTMSKQLMQVLTDTYFDSVISNYQNNIRIGCFTDSPDNEQMWKKYACDKTGYCIEYDTSKNKLFQLSTLPVLYRTRPYDCSLTFANFLILKSNRLGKSQTLEENLEFFKPIYEKILKTAYIPLFIKQKRCWEFEREYRMFLLPHRNARDGMLEASSFLDANYNLDLANAVNAIYLGEDFTALANSSEILKKIIRICKNKKIRLFQKATKNGKTENVIIF